MGSGATSGALANVVLSSASAAAIGANLDADGEAGTTAASSTGAGF
jgi:hypothetical protein